MLGTDDLQATVSMDVGVVRLTEAELHGDPPAPDELANALAVAQAHLEDALLAVPALAEASTVVGIAGTITTVAAVEIGLPNYDPEPDPRLPAPRSRGGRVPHSPLEPLAARVHNPGLPPERADVIVGVLHAGHHPASVAAAGHPGLRPQTCCRRAARGVEYVMVPVLAERGRPVPSEGDDAVVRPEGHAAAARRHRLLRGGGPPAQRGLADPVGASLATRLAGRDPRSAMRSPCAAMPAIANVRRGRAMGSDLIGDALAGEINLNAVQRGPLQNAHVGYWIDEACAGRGYMPESNVVLARHAFDDLRLHRLQVNIIPATATAAG